MLIATLPSADHMAQATRIATHPLVGGVRYNAGIRCSLGQDRSGVEATLRRIQKLVSDAGRLLWVDLKGRQLRITKWADPSFGDIILNREIEVDLPATIFFRGNEWSTLTAIDGNRIFVDPNPEHALGAGQAVNVIGSNLSILGDYLTETDKIWIEAANALGIHQFMLSFVEQKSDVQEVLAIDPLAQLVLKIESTHGLEFVRSAPEGAFKTHRLMAARDDGMINIGENKAEYLKAMQLLIEKDPKAIAASHILTSIERNGYLGLTDLSDIRLLQLMGYKDFMLSDGVSHHCFEEAMNVWSDYWNVFPEGGDEH